METKTTNFQIFIESEDSDAAFEESKALRKFLENSDLEDDLEVKQTRKKLEADDAGGLMEAGIQLLCATPAIVQVAGTLYTWIKNRGKKNVEEQKPMKITIQAANGEMITIDVAQLQTTGPSDKELLGNLMKLLQIGDEIL